MNRLGKSGRYIVGAAAWAVVGVSSAQEVKIKIDSISVEDTVYTPYYEVVTEQDHQQGSSERWIRLGVYFTTEGGWMS